MHPLAFEQGRLVIDIKDFERGMIPTWVKDYIGIPYVNQGRDKVGCDCWGLPYLIYKERLDIDLPSYVDGYVDAAERDEVNKMIKMGRNTNWYQFDQPQLYDLIVFRIFGRDSHIGLIVGKKHFIHVRLGINSCIESFKAGFWKNISDGFYRHEELIGINSP